MLLSAAAFAGSTPGDSLRVKWMDGKKYILHKVESKETWSQLSRRYNVPVSTLMDANSGITDLKAGQIVHVPVMPVEAPATETSGTPTPQPAPAPVSHPVYYTVKHGETLYSVSRRFGMTVEEMRALNKLDSDQLREGQQLVVKYVESGNEGLKTAANPASSASSSNTAGTTTEQSAAQRNAGQDASGSPSTGQSDNTSGTSIAPSPVLFEKPTKSIEPIRKAPGGKTLVQVTETGVASWIPDGDFNQAKYYGLHRSAPIGTIIKVTNRMNNQSVYVKIVGQLPDTGDNENVIIKVSEAVAKRLNALDPLFRAELSYGLMQ